VAYSTLQTLGGAKKEKGCPGETFQHNSPCAHARDVIPRSRKLD